MQRLQPYLFLACLGLFFGTGAALFQHHSAPAALHHIDIPPTRHVEIVNACAAAAGQFAANPHTAAGESQTKLLPFSSLGEGRPPGGLSASELARPSIFELARGPVLSLGAATMGEKQFLRLVDEAGGVKWIGSAELVSSATRAWALAEAPNGVDIDLGASRASLSALWHDFGVVERHSTHSASFTIGNQGDSAITAAGFAKSCGCITLTVEPQSCVVIAPGTEFEVGLTARVGDVDDLSQTFQISLSSGGGSPVALLLGAFGSTPRSPSWSPKSLDYGLLDSIAEAPARRVIVTEAPGERIEVISAEATGPMEFNFTITPELRRGSRAGHLIECSPARLIGSARAGDRIGEIIIKTTSGARPEIRVPYRLTIKKRRAKLNDTP